MILASMEEHYFEEMKQDKTRYSIVGMDNK
jgi:hypothetical protein